MHISAKWSDLNIIRPLLQNVEVFTGGRHRSCRLCMTCADDDESSCTHAQTDRTTNLLISSNVHYVLLGVLVFCLVSTTVRLMVHWHWSVGKQVLRKAEAESMFLTCGWIFRSKFWKRKRRRSASRTGFVFSRQQLRWLWRNAAVGVQKNL